MIAILLIYSYYIYRYMKDILMIYQGYTNDILTMKYICYLTEINLSLLLAKY